MTGVFVPWDATRTDKRSANVGWITDDNGCDIWQGASSSKGYAQVAVDGRMFYVYRVRYEREVGPIPEGMELDHFICDNGAGGCCNPFHCRPVTHWENLLRGDTFAADNAAKTHCPKGHPLSGNNLVPSYLARGMRDCLICSRARGRVAYALEIFPRIPRKQHIRKVTP